HLLEDTCGGAEQGGAGEPIRRILRRKAQLAQEAWGEQVRARRGLEKSLHAVALSPLSDGCQEPSGHQGPDVVPHPLPWKPESPGHPGARIRLPEGLQDSQPGGLEQGPRPLRGVDPLHRDLVLALHGPASLSRQQLLSSNCKRSERVNSSVVPKTCAPKRG